MPHDLSNKKLCAKLRKHDRETHKKTPAKTGACMGLFGDLINRDKLSVHRCSGLFVIA